MNDVHGISEIRSGRHCVFKMHVHLVFVTKYRRRVFDKAVLGSMKTIMAGICAGFQASLVEFNGEQDHVHLLVEYPPKLSVSALVNSLKGASSNALRREFPDLRNHYYKNVLWSPSYFASSCGGAPLSVLRTYIENQATSS